MCLECVDLVVPALLALLMNFAKAILHPLAIFTVSGVLQALADLVFPIPEALAMLSALVIVPITLTISRGRRLTISRDIPGAALGRNQGAVGLGRAQAQSVDQLRGWRSELERGLAVRMRWRAGPRRARNR